MMNKFIIKNFKNINHLEKIKNLVSKRQLLGYFIKNPMYCKEDLIKIFNFEKTSYLVVSTEIIETDLVVTIKILDTPMGKLFRHLLESGIKIVHYDFIMYGNQIAFVVKLDDK